MEKFPGKPKQKSTFPEKMRNTVRAGIAAAAIGGFSPTTTSEISVQNSESIPTVEKVEPAKPQLSAEQFSSILLEVTTHQNSIELILGDVQNKLPYMSSEQKNDMISFLQGRVGFTVAMNARTAFPEYPSFLGDPSLREISKVDRRFVVPLATSAEPTDFFWKSLKFDFEVQTDPVLDLNPDLNTEDIKLSLMKNLYDKYKVNPLALEDSAAAVTRNLYESHVSVTDTTVAAQVQEIQARRALESRKGLFDGDILLVSNEELESADKGVFKQGDPRFGSETLKQALQTAQKTQSSGATRFFNATPLVKKGDLYTSTPESRHKAKETTINIISHSSERLTVFFDGHGSEDAFYFSEGQLDEKGNIVAHTSTERITVEEMTEALIKRYEIQKRTMPAHASQSNITLVFDSCFSQNFMRSVAHQLQKHHIPLPERIITTSEFGQYGYSDHDEPVGSLFNKLIIDSGGNMEKLIEMQYDTPQQTNPTVYVPHKDKKGNETLMQLGGLVIPQEGAVA